MSLLAWWCASLVLASLTTRCLSKVIPADRFVQFTDEEKRAFVDAHNALRRKEQASNMETVQWNEELAEMAQEVANSCTGQHAQPDVDNPPFDPIGQNLWEGSFPPHSDVSAVVKGWYKEKNYYTYDTNTCQEDRICGHYTQVVWATSTDIGCGYANCTDEIGWHVVYCNYGPAGNYVYTKPFKMGQACSECDSGIFWCNDGLCNSTCTAGLNECECHGHCSNCGVLDPETCSCQCEDGWLGLHCTKRCIDTHKYCTEKPGWPKAWCVRPYVLRRCPRMCEICVPDDGPDACVLSK